MNIILQKIINLHRWKLRQGSAKKFVFRGMYQHWETVIPIELVSCLRVHLHFPLGLLKKVRAIVRGTDVEVTACAGIFLPGSVGIQYRYCVFSGGKFKRWEFDNDDFRQLHAHKSESTVMTTSDVLGSKTEESHVGAAAGRVVTSSDNRSMKARQYFEWNKVCKKRAAPKQPFYTCGGSVLVVSYFLPVVLSRSATGAWMATWDTENLLSIQSNFPVQWIGCVRYPPALNPEKTVGMNQQNGFSMEDEDNITRILRGMNCHPVFIPPSVHFEFYDLYCKQVLWPIMHHVADVYGPMMHSAKQQQALWSTYSKVNLMFKKKIIEVYNTNDIIWIHGFHLMLLPAFVRRNSPSAKIGFFFHTPFPSSEIWRTMVRREDLLRGLLQADHIGFHLYEYARHFLTTCRRLLGYSSEMSPSGILTIHADDHPVEVTCIHVGIDLPTVQLSMMSDAFKEEYSKWKRIFEDNLIVCGTANFTVDLFITDGHAI